MNYQRTPDSAFEDLPDYPFEPNYIEVGSKTALRMHYVDVGPKNGTPVLLLHGEPSWSFLYRKMIPGLVEAGHRVLAPDLIGFGKSDKPTNREDYTYQSHLDWLQEWFDKVEISDVVLFCQDWGGLLGLRLVTANTDRFAGVITANTFLPTGDAEPSEAFLNWREFSQSVPEFPVGKILQGATVSELSDEVVSAYDAPYQDEESKAGARQFPTLVPITPDNPASQDNREAWKVLAAFDKPFLTAFSDQDPVTAGGDKFFQKMVPGCQGQNHVTIKDGGHFLQEDKGEELSEVVVQFIRSNNL